MKIKTSITQEREIEVSLPIFRKQINTNSVEYIGMIEEGFVISFYMNNDGTYTSISLAELWVKSAEISKAVQTWQEIDEYEFLQAHEDALQSLSLRPKMVFSELEQEIEAEMNTKDPKNDIEGII